MEEIKDTAEENPDGGDGPLAKKPKQSQRVGLLEMPIVILEHILVHLDEMSLLRASHVCTKFASVAETAFAQKYSNEYYRIHGWYGHNMSFDEVMLSKYGDKIQKLDISVNKKDERLLKLAEQKCCNLNSLNLHYSPRIMLPTGLKKVYLRHLYDLDRASFSEFINKNQQLEILQLEDNNVDLLDLLDGLNNLKTLDYICSSSFVNDLQTIRLDSLETLKLYLPDTEKYKSVLRAITCNELKSLSSLGGDFIDLDDIAIDQICSFETLVSLQLYAYGVTEDQLKALGQRLPHLTEVGMNEMEDVEHTIQLALQSLPKLTKLTIELDADDYHELCDDFKKSMQNFHARFAVTNIEIEFGCHNSIISISEDRTFAIHEDIRTFELLWMNNCNENDLRNVLDRVAEEHDEIYRLKIINECADATVDVSKFMHDCFDLTSSVDIKLNGPITVNANATRLPSFFPNLMYLTIQLENHSAVGLLENLDKKFCKQIKELNIDTKKVPNDADQELEHENDIKDILAKFEDLRSLHVTTSVINFDAKYLVSVCPNLKRSLRSQLPVNISTISSC